MRSIINKFNLLMLVLRISPLLIIVTMLTLSACTSCTKPQTGTIKGRVVLEDHGESATRGPADFSGIMVAAYRIVQADTTLARLNDKYPNIGVVVSQETEFDHRNQAPVAQVTTDEAGEFLFDKLEQGDYNLVFLGETWSVRYLYSISCSPEATTDVGTVDLPAIENLPAFIDSTMVFRSGVQYYGAEDVSVLGEAVFQKGALISMAPGKALKLYGPVSSPDDVSENGYWILTTSYGINETDPVDISEDNYMQSLTVYSPAAELGNLVVRFSDFGIAAMGDSINVNRAYMNNITYGIYALNCKANISNVIIKNGTTYGGSIQNTTQFCSVSNSIFLGGDDGLAISGGTYTLSNTYFYNCYAAFRPFDNSGSIEHCAFEQSSYDIYQYRCSCIIRYNNFYYSKVIGLRTRNYGLVNYNNFYRTDQYYIDIRGLVMAADLDARHNYWMESDLDQHLLDALDNESFPEEPPYNRFVIYNPRRAYPLSEAGIQ